MNLSPPNNSFDQINLDEDFSHIQEVAQMAPSSSVDTLDAPSCTAKGTLLPPNFEPSNYDVICGRGKACANWIGNRRFRVTIAMNKEQYLAAPTKLDKSVVVDQIAKTIKNTSPNGGFVKKDEETGRWYKITDQAARDKVGHAMRDAVAAPQKKARRKQARRRSSRRRKTSPQSVARAPAPVPLEAPSSFDVQPQPIHVSSSCRNSIRASIRGSLKDPEIAAFILETLGGNVAETTGDLTRLSDTSFLLSLQDTAAIQI